MAEINFNINETKNFIDDESLKNFDKQCEEILGEIKKLQEIEKNLPSFEPFCLELFLKFYTFGIYNKLNKIPLWYIAEFMADSENDVLQISSKISYYLWRFTSQFLVNQYDSSTEKYSIKILKLRSGIAFFLDLYKIRLGRMDSEVYSTWQAYEAQLDHTFARFLIRYSYRPLKAEDGIDTEQHWWWKFVDGSIDESKFLLIEEEKPFSMGVNLTQEDWLSEKLSVIISLLKKHPDKGIKKEVIKALKGIEQSVETEAKSNICKKFDDTKDESNIKGKSFQTQSENDALIGELPEGSSTFSLKSC